jgi:lipoprotein-releasing system permease protein
MSRLPFELFLALRYLRPKRTFVSVITLISIVGVMLGVAVLIIVISIMAGFDRQLRETILGLSPHLLVDEGGLMTDHRALRAQIVTHPQVRGVAPYVVGPVLVETVDDGRVFAPEIRGIDPGIESSISVLPDSILAGEFDVSGNGLLVGKDFAQFMGLTVGDQLMIYSIRDLRKMNESLKRNREAGELDEFWAPSEFEIRGIFDVGYFDFNYKIIVCSMGNAQDLYGLDDSVQGLMVMLHDPSRVGQVRAELRPLVGNGLAIRTWEELNSGILDALLVEKNVMFYILFFIVIVAAFGITSALITFVVQKTREIGVLKALGSSNRQIMAIFLGQSFFVGVIGVLAGFGMGILAVAYRNEFLLVMRRVTGFELFPANIYHFSELPALLDFGDIALICGGSLLACIVVGGLFPAWNAGRLRPVEALRHE